MCKTLKVVEVGELDPTAYSATVQYQAPTRSIDGPYLQPLGYL
jgi:hypothetical protein